MLVRNHKKTIVIEGTKCTTNVWNMSYASFPEYVNALEPFSKVIDEIEIEKWYVNTFYGNNSDKIS